MSKFAKKLSEFDKDDVKALDEAAEKFSNYEKDSGLPALRAYSHILIFALLRSQAAIDKLTRVLIALTIILAVLGLTQVGFMIWR